MKTTTPFLRILPIFIFIFLMGKANAQVDEKQPRDISIDGMNNKKMEAIFKSESEDIEGEKDVIVIFLNQ